MKQWLLFLTFLFLAGAAANDVPNNSFEYDFLPVWNRMPAENIQPGKVPRYTYSNDSASGKRSLFLKGQKLELAYETSARFRYGSGIFSLKMKAPQGAVVKVRCQFFLNTTQNVFVEKSFKVTPGWKNYELPVNYPFGRFRRSGMIIGPAKVIIDPGQGEVLVDDLLLCEAKKTPKKVVPGPVGGVPEAQMALVPYLPLPKASDFGKGKCGADSREFRLFPAKGGPERNAFVSGVMLYPQGKVFYNSGSFALYDGKKKLAARFYPISAWPRDRSLAALKVEFSADTAAKAKRLQLRFIPGKAETVVSADKDRKVRFAENSSDLWEANGTLGKAVLTAVDYTGKKYAFKNLSYHFENGTHLRRGKMVSSDGMALGTADVRLRSNAPRKGVELDIALANTSRKFVLIKEFYWQSDVPGNKETLQRTIFGDHSTGKFTEVSLTEGKKKSVTYTALDKLPSFTLSNRQGVSVHVFNGAQTFPNELTFAPGMVKGALWPASAKVLSLAPGMTLRKKFLVSPELPGKTPDHPATVMPSAKAFAEAKTMIPVCAADPGKYPVFETVLKGGLGRLSPAGLHERFCYGQFNYGDHPGDGGWGNLESFEDYVLYHRAMREENPLLFRLAQVASRHYGDIDTDIRNALPHIHSANHIIGGNGFGHAWVPGMMSAWLLTGDAAFYQTARRMLDACIKLPLTSGEMQQGRNFGFFLLTLAEGYAIFNDPAAVKRYMAQLNYQIKRFNDNPPKGDEQRLQRTSVPRQNSLFFVTSSGLVPFHCWYGLAGFLKMYQLTGDPLIKQVLDKEFANIMNLEMTYRPQIETHWPGLPAEKLFPTIATDYLFGRGAFFYPVLAMYADISGKKEFLDLAIDTLYCGVLASRNAGNIQDVFMASPLAAAGKDFNEKKQIEKIKKLLWQGAAPQLLNGDFSQSLLYSDLVIPKNGIGTPRYPDWALKKPYPRNWHFVEGKQVISSMFMTYRGYYYTLDNKEYGKAAPSLRLDMTTKRYFSGGDLNSAKFRMEPGEWEVALSVKDPVNAVIKQLGMRIMAFGKYSVQISVALPPGGKVVPDKKSSELFKLYALSSKETGKPGWKRISFRFRLKEKALGYFRMVYSMLPKAKEAHIHLDDVEIKRIGN